MARAKTRTIIPLDTYARAMAIPGWLFNQVIHPARPMAGTCEPWLQSGYLSSPDRIQGRDEVAEALAVAETQISEFVGFWPGPKWVCSDEILRPNTNLQYPYLKAKYGYIVSGGQEAWELLADDVPIVYTDEDEDGITDTANIVVGAAYLYDVIELPTKCEVAVYPEDREPDPEDDYEIRPLTIVVNELANTITITGPKWQFVDPEIWETLETPELSDDTAFLTHVDVYRHYNDPSKQAEIITDVVNTPALCTSDGCGKTIEEGCISIFNHRLGYVQVQKGTYDTATETWTLDTLCSTTPQRYRLWYLSGYNANRCRDCLNIDASMLEAVVRLANLHLIEAPCGCDATQERWTRDNTELDITTRGLASAQDYFGSPTKGALFVFTQLRNKRLG